MKMHTKHIILKYVSNVLHPISVILILKYNNPRSQKIKWARNDYYDKCSLQILFRNSNSILYAIANDN